MGMGAEDTGPALHSLDTEARLTRQERFGDSREQACWSGQMKNVRTIKGLLACLAQESLFNLELIPD